MSRRNGRGSPDSPGDSPGIRLGGKTYNARMPAYAGVLNDDEAAAVLDDILSRWGNDKALHHGCAKVTAAEVEARSVVAMTPEQVFSARSRLKLDWKTGKDPPAGARPRAGLPIPAPAARRVRSPI